MGATSSILIELPKVINHLPIWRKFAQSGHPDFGRFFKNLSGHPDRLLTPYEREHSEMTHEQVASM
jgi:hypothetical protein